MEIGEFSEIFFFDFFVLVVAVIDYANFYSKIVELRRLFIEVSG